MAESTAWDCPTIKCTTSSRAGTPPYGRWHWPADVVLDIFPDAVETAEGSDLGYGFDTGYKGLVFTISLTSTGVNLGVYGGASLDDPAGLLEGTGRVHRHVKIRTESDLSNDLRELLGSALAKRTNS